jgi:hypothetical protein
MKYLAIIAILMTASVDSCQSRWRAAQNNAKYGPWGPGITAWEEERAEQKAREKAVTPSSSPSQP